jgi:hypothetical protein
MFVPDCCSVVYACAAVGGQSSVSGVRSVSKDYASYVSEQLQNASVSRQQQVEHPGRKLLSAPCAGAAAACGALVVTSGCRRANMSQAVVVKRSKWLNLRCSIS